jgi:hypothetical protein
VNGAPQYSISPAIDAIRKLDRLAVSASDPQVANFARAFFAEHGPQACRMLKDVERHAALTHNQSPAPAREIFNLSDAELEREWEKQ